MHDVKTLGAQEPFEAVNPTGSSTEIQSIYERSRQNAVTWAQTSVRERLVYLHKLRIKIVEQRDRIAEIIHNATGKPEAEAISAEVLVVLEAIRHLEKHAERTLRDKPVKSPITLFGKKAYVSYQPRGVVLVISPWNFPFQLSMVPVLEALVAGNTVILKPSEVTVQVGEILNEILQDVGFPDGVVQVVQGDKAVGAELVQSGPDFIHFTGSVASGRKIQQAAATQLIPTTLELGGKDPMIVFSDANLDRTVQGALWGAFSNSGQICMSVERVYVERSIYDAFVERLQAEISKLKLGSGTDADVGLMTTSFQIDTVKRHVQAALDHGAKLVSGERPEKWNENGRALCPMVLTGVHQRSEIMQEETFGPVLPVLPFDTEAEAIALANESRFGLGASVWTSDLVKARRVAAHIHTGNVCINDAIVNIANPYLPYGGVKEGGIGRYHGEEGLRTFSAQKSVLMSSGKGTREVNWFPYAGKRLLFSRLIASWYGKKRAWGSFLKAYWGLVQLSRKQ